MINYWRGLWIALSIVCFLLFLEVLLLSWLIGPWPPVNPWQFKSLEEWLSGGVLFLIFGLLSKEKK